MNEFLQKGNPVFETILSAIADLAKLRRIELNPNWADAVRQLAADETAEVTDVLGELDACCRALGWGEGAMPCPKPRAHEFPLLASHKAHGWAVAERQDDDGGLIVSANGVSATWPADDDVRLYDVAIPLPAGRAPFANAFDVFKTAVFRRKHVFVFAVAATLVVNIIALVTGLYSMQIYDRVVPIGAFATLWALTLGAVVALLFDFVLRTVRAYMLEDEAIEIDTEVSEYFFGRMADVRLDARPPSVGTMAAQLRGLEQVRSFLSSSLLLAFADLPFALIFIAFIGIFGGSIVLVPLVAFPLALGLAWMFARMIHADTVSAHVSSNRKNGLLVEALDSAETIKANRGQWFLMARWSRLLDNVHDAELPVRKLQAKAGALFGTMQQMTYIIMVAIGAIEVFENRMTMGALIACSIVAGRINGPLLGQLPSMLVQWSYARSSLAMLDAIMDLPVDRPADVEQLRPSRLSGAIELRGVGFAYPGGQAGVSVTKLVIHPGEKVGMLGSIGSGKSTMLKLMSGIYHPAVGQVLMDRLNAAQIAPDILCRHIGYLPQDYRLVNGSLRDNLLLGLPDPGDDAIMAMAQKTGLAGLITSHPRGLDLPISEGGRGLSGGQRVLTGLTRLLLARPKILLLDEPTANLDVDTEARVLKALREEIDEDATLIMITHKLQLIGMVDRLLFVAGGKVVLDGPNSEVMARLRGEQPAKPVATPNVSASHVTVTPRAGPQHVTTAGLHPVSANEG